MTGAEVTWMELSLMVLAKCCWSLPVSKLGTVLGGT